MKRLWNNIDYGDNVQEIVKNNNCTIFRMQDDTGEGTMTAYDIFPGAMIIYNDFHMLGCNSQFHTGANLLCIDYCRVGCIEQEMGRNAFSYLEAGDLRIDRRKKHSGNFHFPLNHYHGISIAFYLPEAQKSLKDQIKDFSVNLYDLQKRYCENQKPYVIKSETGISHILLELYKIPAKIKKDYFRIRVFELLLYLDALELDEHKEERPYFYREQVEKIKAIHELLTEDLMVYYTTQELSERFDISQTSLKNCFKSVYGSPIFTYMRAYRINKAAAMLKLERTKNISEIAGLVGYDSPSKFTVAFRKLMGKTPLEYRKYISG